MLDFGDLTVTGMSPKLVVWSDDVELLLSRVNDFKTSPGVEWDTVRIKHFVIRQVFPKYTLNSEPKALTGDKSEGIKSRGAAEAFIRGFSPVKAEGEEFNVLILSYTRELSRPFKENKG